MSTRLVPVISGIIAGFLILYLSLSNFDLAGKKPFWLDEGNEIAASCADSPMTLLERGAGSQCSPNPLYYGVEKAVAGSLLHGRFDQSILWKYRSVSLFSAFLLLSCSLTTVWSFFGPIPALLSVFALANPAIFQHFAAENRPYMLWLLLFACSFLWSGYISRSSRKRPSSQERCVNGILLLLLTLVAGAGGVQALALLFGIYLFRRQEWKWLAGTSALVLGVAYYYGKRACHYDSAGIYDLLQTRDFALVRPVIELIWLSPSHMVGLISDLLLLCGLFLPLSPRMISLVGSALGKNSGKGVAMIRTIHRHLWLQLLAALVIALLVVFKHYYFVDRIFIFLIFLKTIAVSLGGFILLTVSRDFFLRVRFPFIELILPVLIGMIVVVAAHKRKAAILDEVPKEMALISGTSVSCEALRGNWIGYVRAGSSPEVAPNAIVAFSKLLGSCRLDSPKTSAPTVAGTGYVLFTSEGGFKITRSVPAEGGEYELLTQFGKSYPIRLSESEERPGDAPLHRGGSGIRRSSQ